MLVLVAVAAPPATPTADEPPPGPFEDAFVVLGILLGTSMAVSAITSKSTAAGP
jgi:hypothetical protein